MSESDRDGRRGRTQPPDDGGAVGSDRRQDQNAADHPREHADGRHPDVDPDRRAIATWLWRLPVLAALGGGAYGVYRGWQVHFVKPPPGEPEFETLAPVRVASLDAFAELWSATPFSAGGHPAVAIRVPEPVPGSLRTDDGRDLVGFSRVCTHQGCIVDLNRSPEAIAVAANYRTDHPSLVCGCHLSVFDPLQGGRAMSGPAQLPLARVELDIRDDAVYAVGIERA